MTTKKPTTVRNVKRPTVTSEDQIVLKIQEVRSRNNVLWMDLLRIALEAAPDKAKATLELINKNDAQISALVAKLAKTKNWKEK